MTPQWFIAPLTTLVAAILGLGIWRLQLIAKRKYEVAEQILLAVNAATAALHNVCRAKADADAIALLNPEAPRPTLWAEIYARYQGAEQSFSSLDSTSKLTAMHFGEAAAKPLRDLQAIQNELSAALTGLYFRGPAGNDPPTQDEQRSKWESVLSQRGDNDLVTRRIDDLDVNVRNQFGRYLRPGLLRLFFPF